MTNELLAVGTVRVNKQIMVGFELFTALPKAVQNEILKGLKSDLNWVKGYSLTKAELIAKIKDGSFSFKVTYGDFGIHTNCIMIECGDFYNNFMTADTVGAEWLEKAFPVAVEAEAVQAEQDSEEYEFRICDECKEQMTDGYVIEDGSEYYCKDECLHKHYTPEQYKEMYEDDTAYWTEGFSGWSPNVEKAKCNE